ncbi:YfjI family protein [Xanthobacter variabilis]|uniref:YfjI family protein n=1 Tax=Xanthobacter variabilis TaxID=3119932 RepID=UPI00374E4BF1
MLSAPAPIPFKAEGPQPLVRDIPSGQPYPTEALGPLQDAAVAAHDMSQAPIAIAAQSALAVASLAVQGFADVETLGGDAPCSLFCLTIAESGERKSTCDRLLMRGAHDYERDLERAHKPAHAEWLTTKELWEAKRKRLMGDIAGKDLDRARAAEADLHAMGPEPTAPLLPTVMIQEPTFEGTIKLFQAGRPSLGLFNDEGGGFTGGHAMNADNRLKTMAGLSKLWDGASINRTRAGDGVATLRGRRLATHLMAQPIAARPLMADPQASGQGFLARFLVTEPPSAIGTRLRRGHMPSSEGALSAFADHLRAILETPLPTGDDPQELAPARLPLSKGAKELLWRFYEVVEKAQQGGGALEHVRSYASKSAEQAARIAGVLTLWADLNAREVSAETMAQGVTLAQFYLEEASRLAEIGAVSEETARAERLLAWLRESWPHDDVTPTEILNKGPNALRERARLNMPLAALVKAGWLVPLEAGTVVRGTARKEAYRVVRAPHVV